MAFGEFGMLTSSVLMKFKVDTSEAKAKLKELTGEEKKAAEAALKLQEAKNRQMESWAKGLAKASAGVMLVQKSISALGDSWKAYEKHAMAAGGADKEKALRFREALSSMSSSMDKVKVAIGGIVANLAPLVELAARLLGIAADVVGFLGDSDIGGIKAEIRRRTMVTNDRGGLIGSRVGVWDANRQLQGWGQFADINAGIQQGINAIPKPRSRGEAQASGAPIYFVEDGSGRPVPVFSWDVPATPSFMGAFSDPGSYVGPGGLAKVDADPFAGAAAATESLRGFQEQLGAAGAKNFAEQIFGPMDQFNGYIEGFKILSNAVESAYAAWASGAMSAGKAFKMAIGQGVMALGQEMLVRALFATAQGTAYLFTPGMQGQAAGQFKAAALWGAGAIAAGVVSRQLGAGGGGGGGGGGYSAGGGAPTMSTPSGGGSGGGTNVTVIYGADGEDSPRFRARSVHNAFDLARRYHGEDKTVEYR